MPRLARLLSYLAAALSAPLLIRPVRGWAAAALWFPKLLGDAWSPWLAVAGGLGTLLGVRRKDTRAVVAGLFATAVATRHAAQVSAPHDGFELAFGRGWTSRITPELEARLRPTRYMPLPPNVSSVSWQPDVVIGSRPETGDALLCDVWGPAEEAQRTGLAVVYLHGSAWHYGDKDRGTRHFFHYLASQGHLILDVAYTLAPKARLHAMLADVRQAVAWIKINGPEYGVDAARIVLMGGSAGGHLALLAAYTAHELAFQTQGVSVDTSVCGVVSYYGPPDLASLHGHLCKRYGRLPGKTGLIRLLARLTPMLQRAHFVPPGGQVVDTSQLLPDLLGGTPQEAPELYRLGSPIYHIGPHCPPTLLLQGAHDLTGMTPDVRRLYRALREADVPCVYVEFPATEHAFDLFSANSSPSAQAALYDTERFLALMAAKNR
jgi:acetyl esterase/lipase